MNFSKQILRLYALTDRSCHPELSLNEQVRQAIEGGATCIQLREKHADFETFLQEAKDLAKLCHAYDVPLIINDHLEIALQAGADGVHLGQNDLDLASAKAKAGSLWVGISSHSVEEAIAAQNGGADYLGSGALFTTSSKPDVHTLPIETFRQICQAVDIPVVGIGGITLENVDQLAKTGMAGPAIIQGIFGQPNITKACQKLVKKLDQLDLEADPDSSYGMDL